MSGTPPLQPITTRTGGGRAARIAAGAVAVTLVVMAWLGVSGPRAIAPERPVSPSPTATRGDVAVAPSPVPTPRGEAQRDVPLAAEQYHRLMMQRADAYAVLGSWDGRHYLVFLAEPTDGRLFGEARMPLPRRPTRATFELLHLWTREPAMALEVMQRWTAQLPRRERFAGPGTHVVIEDSRAPENVIAGPRLGREGYAVRVRIEWLDRHAMLIVDVTTPTAERRQGPRCERKEGPWARGDC